MKLSTNITKSMVPLLLTTEVIEKVVMSQLLKKFLAVY